ncbi:MAG TPA: hypothetical protein PKA00_09050 [Saprospiraceae bacterium]|nr:hypothetical protein [Saprospiraceae bacterium]HMQ83043.1 hypothetical protein [Saprospiraceae bacterium]
MKKIIFLNVCFFIILSSIISQNDNPYSIFGCEGNILRTPQERQQFMLIIENMDKESSVKKLGIDPANQKYYVFGESDEILTTDDISQNEISRFLSVDPLAKNFPWNSVYAFAENDVIRAVDLEGLERAVVINNYINGNPSRTTVLQVFNAQGVLQNFNATGNGVNNLTMNDILEINTGQLPAGTQPFVPRIGVAGVNNGIAPFSPDEQSILNVGADRTRLISHTLSRKDDVEIAGFTFPGATPAQGQLPNTLTNSIGTFQPVPIMQTRTITTTRTVTTAFPNNTVGNTPLAINPLSGAVLANPTNQAGFNQVQGLFNLARQNNVNSININIGMNLGSNINVNQLQNDIATSLGSTFNYSGTINVLINNVGINQGFVNISSPGGTVQNQVTETSTQQVQVGTSFQLNPN